MDTTPSIRMETGVNAMSKARQMDMPVLKLSDSSGIRSISMSVTEISMPARAKYGISNPPNSTTSNFALGNSVRMPVLSAKHSVTSKLMDHTKATSTAMVTGTGPMTNTVWYSTSTVSVSGMSSTDVTMHLRRSA